MAARLAAFGPADEDITVEVDNRCRMCGEVREGPADARAVCRACRPRAARQMRRIREAERQGAMMPSEVWMSPQVAEAMARMVPSEAAETPASIMADFLSRAGAFVAGGGE